MFTILEGTSGSEKIDDPTSMIIRTPIAVRPKDIIDVRVFNGEITHLRVRKKKHFLGWFKAYRVIPDNLETANEALAKFIKISRLAKRPSNWPKN